MSKLYVYNRIPLYGPKRRNKNGKEYPVDYPFRVVHYGNVACEVKPAGKGNHATIQVRTAFLYIVLPGGRCVDLNLASARDIFEAMGV